MLRFACLALAQMGEPLFRNILIRALALTVALVGLIAGALFWLVDRFAGKGPGWLQSGADILAGLGLAAGSILLIPPVAVMAASLFLDPVAHAVEARHYAGDPPGKSLAPGPALRTGLSFFAALAALNLIALPLYLLPGPNLALYLVLNGYLVGREYFELAALRHVPAREAARLRRQNPAQVYGAGALIALAFAVPILNLLAPLFGAAFMVHIFKHVQSRPRP